VSRRYERGNLLGEDASEGGSPQRQTSTRGEFCCLNPYGLSVASSPAIEPGILNKRKTF